MANCIVLLQTQGCMHNKGAQCEAGALFADLLGILPHKSNMLPREHALRMLSYTLAWTQGPKQPYGTHVLYMSAGKPWATYCMQLSSACHVLHSCTIYIQHTCHWRENHECAPTHPMATHGCLCAPTPNPMAQPCHVHHLPSRQIMGKHWS